LSRTSGEDRLKMVHLAYMSVERALGPDHERVKRISKYYHDIIGNAWARRKLYELGLGRNFPENPLRCDNDR
jgi:hypothetical protein